MARVRNTFIEGVMDKDTNKSLTKNTRYFHAENMRFHNDGDDFVGKNIKGTLLVSDMVDGSSDFKCIAALYNEDKDVIYYYLASTDRQKSKIIEYDVFNDTSNIVLDDTNGVLNFNKDGYITGINELDGLLIWAEWGNNPRIINIERAKGYGLNGFTEDDIAVIKKPPIQKLRVVLEDTPDDLKENNIEEKFISFSYRWKYLDGGYSVLAPFTEFPFQPDLFDYNFNEQTNRSMVNQHNQVSIDFFTGDERVTEIQLVFKESGSNTEWIIDDFNKEMLGYSNNSIETFKFNNLKGKRALDDNIIRSYYDNVPKTALAQVNLGSRIGYGNYKENFNIENPIGSKIKMDYSISIVSEENTKQVSDGEGGFLTVPSLIPRKTIKSNRDLEVDIVYIFDDYGRMTTNLSSKTNTIHIPASKSNTKNSLNVTLKHLPPIGAKYYRFFIRQNKKNYDTILPTLFYEDGRYRWVKIEGADVDKVKKGDYLIVKSDSKRIQEQLIKIKVLDVVLQEKNFLHPVDKTDTIEEESGLYFKIYPENFNMDLSDYINYFLITYNDTKRVNDLPFRGEKSYISYAHFYGDTLDDMTSNSGDTSLLSQREKKRYLIEIDDDTAGNNTFRWSDNDGADWVQENVAITAGLEQVLNYGSVNDGVKITFQSNDGHSLNDNWNINVKGTFHDVDSRAYGVFSFGAYDHEGNYGEATEEEGIDNLKNDKIKNGARIKLEYDEYGRGNTYFKIEQISSNYYDNIEEWYHKENIADEIMSQAPNFDLSRITFMRADLSIFYDNNIHIYQDNNGSMCMVLESQEHRTLVENVKVKTNSEILQTQNDNWVVFETEPIDQPKEIFHEIGKTYKIENGYHLSDTDDFETQIENVTSDQNQTASQDLIVRLDWHNAWSYGNGVESYKIKDDFNSNSLDNGVRVLTSIKEEYKEVTRKADITWSNVYNDETNYNGLNTFNLSTKNFIKLNKEEGSIQKLHNSNGNLIVLQEDAVGVLPINKNIIYDVKGKDIVGVSTNILDKRSYRLYDNGRYGISKHPESFVEYGHRSFFTDQQRGSLIQLASNGLNVISKMGMSYEFSNEMLKNKNNKLIAGYDPRHDEYMLNLPANNSTLIYSYDLKGFTQYITIQPDFILGANNEMYGWYQGRMYKMNSTNEMNTFFGEYYESRIKYFVNKPIGIDKVFQTLKLYSNKPCRAVIKTELTGRTIEKTEYEKRETYYYTAILGNTNNNLNASAVFGLGEYAIVNGEIFTDIKYSTLSVGDKVKSVSQMFSPAIVTDILDDRIVTDNPTLNVDSSFLMYEKNQNIDGNSIRGDVLEVELIFDDLDEVVLKATDFGIIKSYHS